MTPAEDLDRLLSAAADGELSGDDLARLADLLRDDPAAREAYLDYLLLDSLLAWETPRAEPAVPATPAGRGRVVGRFALALAASLLLGAGVALYLASTPREAAARGDVVDWLADWNLAIADAPPGAGRQERYRERAGALGGELARANLPANDQRLADALFENARALADADTPLAVAEQLDAASEQLLACVRDQPGVDLRREQALERHSLRFAERSLSNLRRAWDADAPDDVKKKRAERVAERIARRADALAAKEAGRALKRAQP